ncbi:MAG: hypothetical protein KJ041_04075 [Gammaproteobacteria bacterium]|nr:hypothetical protein [Gammaproteobacteria bacterium]
MSGANVSLLVRLAAHFRPQPAIPAVFVMLLTLMGASTAAGAPEAGVLVTWGIPLGILASCGLAVASGFCSFFPPLIWMALAAFGLGLIGRTPAAMAGSIALYIGLAAAVGTLALQFWRVRTGRFVPTFGSASNDNQPE